MVKGVTGNSDEGQEKSGRLHTVAKSKTTQRSTGTLPVPVLADTLRVAIDNLIAGGFVVRAGNLHGGLVIQVEGMLRCDACGRLVPTAFWYNDGCINCMPVASTGNGTGGGT